MPWKECSVMDERLQFVASRRGDGGTLQRVWDRPQDRLQDLRSLPAMRHSRVNRQEPTSLSLCPSTSVPDGELHPQREARAFFLSRTENRIWTSVIALGSVQVLFGHFNVR